VKIIVMDKLRTDKENGKIVFFRALVVNIPIKFIPHDKCSLMLFAVTDHQSDIDKRARFRF
jgi:hypothetical protein